jgi:hypothetical protein
MITHTRSIRAFAPGGVVKPKAEPTAQLEPFVIIQTDDYVEPRTSFFRGVVIALVGAIPVWAWIILSIIR